MQEFDHDIINKAEHYNVHPSGVETLAIIRHETFLRGNIIKYVMRAPYKNDELEDLKKARFYLDEEIERLEGPADKTADELTKTDPFNVRYEVPDGTRMLILRFDDSGSTSLRMYNSVLSDFGFVSKAVTETLTRISYEAADKNLKLLGFKQVGFYYV